MINLIEIQENAQKSDEHSDASLAYQNSQVNTMSGNDIVVELYKGIIKNIRDAKEAYKVGRLDDMCTLIAKTNKILIALQAHLNFENGGEAASTLNRFYTGVFGDLTKILRQDDPEFEFDRIIQNIQPVYEIWCRHAMNEKNPTQD